MTDTDPALRALHDDLMRYFSEVSMGGPLHRDTEGWVRLSREVRRILTLAAAAEAAPLDPDGDPIPADPHSEDWYDGYAAGQRDAAEAAPLDVESLLYEMLRSKWDGYNGDTVIADVLAALAATSRDTADAGEYAVEYGLPVWKEHAAEAAPLDVERLAATLQALGERDIIGGQPRGYYKAAARNIAREYAALAATSREDGL